MVRPPLGLFERKYRKKPQIVQSIDGMGGSELQKYFDTLIQ